MTILAEEYFRGRRGDAYSSRERDYLVTGTGGDADLQETAAINAAISVSPSSIAGTDGSLLRVNANISRIISNSQMIVDVQYGESGYSGAAVKPIGTVEYEFSYQAPSVQIEHSLQTISVTGVSGPQDPNMFGGLIRPVKDSDEVLGMDTGPGNTTNVWAFTRVTVTTAYEALVESMMGAVNSVPFKTRPAGTMRLVNCTSQNTSSSKSNIRFGMQFEANRTNIPVGDIIVPSKDGHDYMWVQTKREEFTLADGVQKRIVHRPEFAVVERVYPRQNFGLLGF